MNLNLNYYITNNIYPFFISKFFNYNRKSKYNLAKIFNPGGLSHIILRINLVNLKGENDLRIINSLELLKELSGQLPKVNYIINGYIKGNRSLAFSCKVTLRKKRCLKFLSYYIECLSFFVLNGQLVLNKKYDPWGNCFIDFQNVNLFRGLSERMYLFKDKINLEFYFFTNCNSEIRQFFFNLLKI